MAELIAPHMDGTLLCDNSQSFVALESFRAFGGVSRRLPLTAAPRKCRCTLLPDAGVFSVIPPYPIEKDVRKVA